MKNNDILFLIGAGCSFDANIPTSKKMIEQLEKLILENSDWKKYKSIYNFLKSHILISDSLTQQNQDFHIEKLLTTTQELLKGKTNPIYVFTNGWSMLYNEFMKGDLLKEFDKQVRQYLPLWVIPEDDYKASYYYSKFYNLQLEIAPYPLRVFSLNYDMCFEKNTIKGAELETGFADQNEWKETNFTENEIGGLHLFKLHGSIDWYIDDKQKLKKTNREGVDKPFLIFGTDDKVQAIDPYLFYLHEFRKWTLESNIIFVIGYSYSDAHINSLLLQTLNQKKDRIIFNVDVCEDEEQKRKIQNSLKLKDQKQIKCINSSAKDFLQNTMTIDFINSLIPNSSENNPF